jgi:hypothetical protein
MSTKKGEVIVENDPPSPPITEFRLEVSAIVKILYTKNGKDRELLVAGLRYKRGEGFSRMEGVPTTLYLSNLIDWMDGVDVIGALIPIPALRDKVVARLTELKDSNLRLDLNSINIDIPTGEINFEVKIPGISIAPGDFNLPDINGLQLGVEDVFLKVARTVTVA